ncbi:MAG: hypothetical protein HZB29_07890 [Nitrospinae bacterium]|nr:hypothetical protein [Nitrospinota bacterium]
MSAEFTELFTGRLEGILSEEGYISLAESLEGDWTAVNFTQGLVEAIDAGKAAELLRGLHAEVKARRMINIAYPYTYVHTPESPRMIKTYDPSSCGGGCSATASPDPWWVLSRVKPSAGEIESLKKKKPEERKGLLTRMLGA